MNNEANGNPSNIVIEMKWHLQKRKWYRMWVSRFRMVDHWSQFQTDNKLFYRIYETNLILTCRFSIDLIRLTVKAY